MATPLNYPQTSRSLTGSNRAHIRGQNANCSTDPQARFEQIQATYTPKTQKWATSLWLSHLVFRFEQIQPTYEAKNTQLTLSSSQQKFRFEQIYHTYEPKTQKCPTDPQVQLSQHEFTFKQIQSTYTTKLKNGQLTLRLSQVSRSLGSKRQSQYTPKAQKWATDPRGPFWRVLLQPHYFNFGPLS